MGNTKIPKAKIISLACCFVLAVASVVAIFVTTNKPELGQPSYPETFGHIDNINLNGNSYYLPISLSSDEVEGFEKEGLCHQSICVYETDRARNATDFENIYWGTGRFFKVPGYRFPAVETGVWQDQYGRWNRVIAFFYKGKIFHVYQTIYSDGVYRNDAEHRFDERAKDLVLDDYFVYKNEKQRVSELKHALELKIMLWSIVEILLLAVLFLAALLRPRKENNRAFSASIYIFVCSILALTAYYLYIRLDLYKHHFYGNEYNFGHDIELGALLSLVAAAFYTLLLLWMGRLSRQPFNQFWLIPAYFRIKHGNKRMWNRLQYTLVFWPLVYLAPIPVVGWAFLVLWCLPTLFILLIIKLISWIVKGGDKEAQSDISVGEENEDILFCRFCGRQIQPDSLFCPKCGKKLD